MCGRNPNRVVCDDLESYWPTRVTERYSTFFPSGIDSERTRSARGNYSREIWRLQYSQNRAATAPPPDPSGTTGGGAPLSCSLR